VAFVFGLIIKEGIFSFLEKDAKKSVTKVAL
jgi:hypothetical protein